MNKSERSFYFVATALFALAYFIFKFFTMGWLTIIFGLGFIALGVVYCVYGTKFARKVNKAAVDYVLYWLISVFLVLFALFFIDFGDVSVDVWHAQIIKIIPHTASTIISAVCGCITLALMIAAGIIAIARKVKAKK